MLLIKKKKKRKKKLWGFMSLFEKPYYKEFGCSKKNIFSMKTDPIQLQIELENALFFKLKYLSSLF